MLNNPFLEGLGALARAARSEADFAIKRGERERLAAYRKKKGELLNPGEVEDVSYTDNPEYLAALENIGEHGADTAGIAPTLRSVARRSLQPDYLGAMRLAAQEYPEEVQQIAATAPAELDLFNLGGVAGIRRQTRAGTQVDFEPMKTKEEKPTEQWEDLGYTKVGRNLVHTQINKLTGKKEMKSLSPEQASTIVAGYSSDPLVSAAAKDLPKQREQAEIADSSYRRLSKMLPLIETGSAGGLSGKALSEVSRIFDTPATSEAALFDQLSKLEAGQLRATVIGPGAVSNYENQLLQTIAGGGTKARQATIDLLKYYQSEASKTVRGYNSAVRNLDNATGGRASTVFGLFDETGGGLQVGDKTTPEVKNGGVRVKTTGPADPLGIL